MQKKVGRMDAEDNQGHFKQRPRNTSLALGTFSISELPLISMSPCKRYCVPSQPTRAFKSVYLKVTLNFTASSLVQISFMHAFAFEPLSPPAFLVSLARHRDTTKAYFGMCLSGSRVYTEILFCFTLLKTSSPIYLSIYFSGYPSSLKMFGLFLEPSH